MSEVLADAGVNPRVRLVTTDGDERIVEAMPGQSVVEAAAAASIILPSLCGKGTCGTCVGRLWSGEVHMRPFEDDALGPSAGEDAVLLCCAEPTGDLEVGLPFDSSKLVEQAPAERTVSVTDLTHLTPHIVRLQAQLEPDELMGAAAEFEAGQYMQLQVPGTDVLRAYSMSNVSNWDGALEFLIHIRDQGLFSTWLDQQASVGDQLRAVGPQGTFALVENGMRPRWFVGGGCGLAPLLSMLRRMAEWGDPQPTRLVLGVTTTNDIFALDEVRELADQLPELTVTLAVWEGEVPDDEGQIRYVEGSSVDVLAHDLDAVDDPEQLPDIYVCGPPGMVKALEESVAERGIDPELVHTERITQN